MDWSLIISTAAFLFSAISLFVLYFQNKRLEDYKQQLAFKQKAEVFAEFLSKWGKYRGGEADILKSDAELYDFFEDLNRMSYEVSLFIDDDNLLNEIGEAFSKEVNDVRPLLMKVRAYLLGEEKAKSSIQIAIWPGDQKTDKRLFPHLYDQPNDKRFRP